MFNPDSITYFFVIDGLNFEGPAMLLSRSLRQVMGDEVAIIAYVPEDKIDTLKKVTLNILRKHKVEIRTINVQSTNWANDYPHGNKILAACDRRDTDLSVLLDTDVVCLNRPDFSQITSETALFAAPEGVPTWERNDAHWQPVYDMFNLPLPDWRVQLLKGRKIKMLPYFNAGVVGFVEQGNAKGMRLPDVWLETAQLIDANDAIENKRPWLDQISLPVAAARMGGATSVLDEAYNFSPYRRRKTPDLSDVKFFHYHIASFFCEQEKCQKLYRQLFRMCPKAFQLRLTDMLKKFKAQSSPE